MPSDEAASADGKITLTIQMSSGKSMVFRVKPTTQVSKLLNAFSNNVGSKMRDLRFLHDGNKLLANQNNTIADMDIEDGDVIDCMVEQQGGMSGGQL